MGNLLQGTINVREKQYAPDPTRYAYADALRRRRLSSRNVYVSPISKFARPIVATQSKNELEHLLSYPLRVVHYFLLSVGIDTRYVLETIDLFGGFVTNNFIRELRVDAWDLMKLAAWGYLFTRVGANAQRIVATSFLALQTTGVILGATGQTDAYHMQ